MDKLENKQTQLEESIKFASNSISEIETKMDNLAAKLKKVDYNKLAISVDVEELYSILNCDHGNEANNVEDAYLYLCNAIKNSCIKSRKRKSRPWFDKECFELKVKTRRSYARIKKNNSEKLLAINSQLVAEFQRLKRKKKHKYQEEQIIRMIEKAEASISEFWSLWRTRKTRSGGSQVSPEMWFDHFSALLHTDNLPMLPYYANVETDDDPFSWPIDESEVLIAFGRGKAGKAAGPDGITYDVLKNCSEILVTPITQILNFCFLNSFCPSEWLIGYLLPIYKDKRSLSHPDSYRGIALSLCVLKCYTYILSKRILNWAETQGILPAQQHGFRSKLSTETTVKELNMLISNTLTIPKCPLYVAFVDFKKAFDSVDRGRLLRKLCELGLHPKIMKALWSLLRENYIKILTNNVLSEAVAQSIGLAQ
ncbi:uncharacterized protein LOC117106482, partial [Anneissia japonica]|uniref:uncharacterized protein LOC117106482 n=1 Tax=Anneissia japonica TaxID=1529436 RepID=UPI001425A50F